MEEYTQLNIHSAPLTTSAPACQTESAEVNQLNNYL